MFDGDWGTRSEVIVAVAAIAALGFSLVSLLWQWRSAESRKEWEAEQARQQNRFTEEQRRKQNEWQEERSRLHTEREAQWRAEDKQQMEDWRREDIARFEHENTPKIRVTTRIQDTGMNPKTGLVDLYVSTDGVNVGRVDTWVTNWGTFYLEDGTKLEWSKSTEHQYGVASSNIDRGVEPGGTMHYDVRLDEVRRALRENDLHGTVKIHGFFTDQLHRDHLSDPLTIDVDNQ